MDAGDNSSETQGQPELLPASLYGLCPRCGNGTLFGRWGDQPAQVEKSCRDCGLEFSRYERGARLAGPVAFIYAAIIITCALTVDAYIQFEWWINLLVWGSAMTIGVIYVLRLYKTALLYRAYYAAHDQDETGS